MSSFSASVLPHQYLGIFNCSCSPSYSSYAHTRGECTSSSNLGFNVHCDWQSFSLHKLEATVQSEEWSTYSKVSFTRNVNSLIPSTPPILRGPRSLLQFTSSFIHFQLESRREEFRIQHYNLCLASLKNAFCIHHFSIQWSTGETLRISEILFHQQQAEFGIELKAILLKAIFN